MELHVSRTVEALVAATYLANTDQVVALTQTHLQRSQCASENAAWTSMELPDRPRNVTWNALKDVAVWSNASQTACYVVDARTLEQFHIQLPDTTSHMECVAVSRRASHVVFESLHHLHVWRRRMQTTDGTWLTLHLPLQNPSARPWHAISQSRTLGSLLLVGSVITRPSDDGNVNLICTTDYFDLDDVTCRVVAAKATSISLEHGSVVLDVCFQASRHALAIHTSTFVVTLDLHSQTHSTQAADAVTSCTWGDRGLYLSYPDGRLQLIGGPSMLLKAPLTPSQKLACFSENLLVYDQQTLHVYQLSTPPPPSTIAHAAAASAPLHTSSQPTISSMHPFLRLHSPLPSLVPLINQFVRQSPTDTPPAQWLTAFVHLAKIVCVSHREDLLPKLTALAMHGLHLSWPHSMRQLLGLLLRHLQPLSPATVDTFAALLKETPSQTPTTKPMSSLMSLRYCTAIDSMRHAQASPLPFAHPPWAPTLASYYHHTFAASPHELSSWVPILYDMRKVFYLVDKALLRRDPQDLRYLRLVAVVMTCHFVKLTPLVPSLPYAVGGNNSPPLMALTMWETGSSSRPHDPQWSLSTAIVLAMASDSVPFLLALCLQFSTSHTDEFVSTVCRQQPTHNVPLVVRCLMRQLRRMYASMPLLPYHPRRKHFDNRQSLNDVPNCTGSKCPPPSTSTTPTGLCMSQIYRLYTMTQPSIPLDLVASSSNDEMIAAQFAVDTLRRIKRFLLILLPSPSVMSSLGSVPPSVGQLELAHRVDPHCIWPFLDHPSTATSSQSSPLLAAFAATAWACIVRELAAQNHLHPRPRHGCWHLARLSSAAVFRKSDVEIRTAQLQHLAASVRDCPGEVVDALAFVLSVGTKAVMAKRTAALVAMCDQAGHTSQRSVEAVRAWMADRRGHATAWDPWFWAFCTALTDLETVPVQRCRTIHTTIHEEEVAKDRGATDVSDAAARTSSLLAPSSKAAPSRQPPLQLMQARRSLSDSSMKQQTSASSSVANVLKLLQLQKAKHVTASSAVDTWSHETSVKPSTPPRMPAPVRRGAVQPLVFEDVSPPPLVALKLLRKCHSSVENPTCRVSLRPRDFFSAAPSSSGFVTDPNGVTDIAARGTQTTPPPLEVVNGEPCRMALPVESGPSTNTLDSTAEAISSGAPKVSVTSTATMTTRTTDNASQTSAQGVSYSSEGRMQGQPNTRNVAPNFPVYVAIQPGPHSERGHGGYLHVADLDLSRSDASSSAAIVYRTRLETREDKETDGGDGIAASTLFHHNQTIVENSNEASHDADPLLEAYENVGADDAEGGVRTDGTEEHREVGSTRHVVAGGRVTSMKEQMQTMRQRLQHIESLADMIDSEFAHSHELITQMEDRRRGLSGLLDRGFASQLQRLDDATATMQHSLEVAKGNLVESAAAKPTSVLAKKAADGMANAKQLLRQLESTLALPGLTDNI
ncbi:hypothetical protein, variant [Aphanomyces astaci]|uniref:Uncharacterized protein n=1 Tax=Aphanomyces astaci TaxID=112090 RepID=W4GYU6_APHAT|nr:hypothetical protein, variant [Aphanomyces astaci]ETV84910.1 hypothetical protein, variant [Aphanomyces astaci]|eukprot:XP_009824928.1 hypothetical protein, variant [Aphanomyces astaci]